MTVGPHYLSPEGDAIVRATAKALGDDLAARRALRDTARRLDIDLRPPVDRRSANDRRVCAERRGAVTVLDDDGAVIIQPRPDLARFERHPVDVTAFRLDDTFRGM